MRHSLSLRAYHEHCCSSIKASLWRRRSVV